MYSDHTGPINLGNDQEISMLQLIEAIGAAMGTSLSVVHQPLPKDDPVRRRPDLAKARTLLGYAPRVGLNEGIVQTIAYFKRTLSESDSG
jgi:nucleoside-diphosphate-sugar epimerase